MFFDDPRTREQYLQWAPVLLTAENWHATRRTAPSTPTTDVNDSLRTNRTRTMRNKRDHTFTLYEHPIKESDVDSYITALLWLGHLGLARDIARQMRDAPNHYHAMPRGFDRDIAREERIRRWNYWHGVYAVLSNLTARTEARRQRKRAE